MNSMKNIKTQTEKYNYAKTLDLKGLCKVDETNKDRFICRSCNQSRSKKSRNTHLAICAPNSKYCSNKKRENQIVDTVSVKPVEDVKAVEVKVAGVVKAVEVKVVEVVKAVEEADDAEDEDVVVAEVKNTNTDAIMMKATAKILKATAKIMKATGIKMEQDAAAMLCAASAMKLASKQMKQSAKNI